MGYVGRSAAQLYFYILTENGTQTRPARLQSRREEHCSVAVAVDAIDGCNMTDARTDGFFRTHMTSLAMLLCANTDDEAPKML